VIGRTIGGKYAIVRRLGEGGMGAVYEARHTGTGRRVALKVITGELVRDARLVERFEREALAAGAIESEHIVQIFDVGRDEASGEPFLAMELLSGEDLHQILARLGPIPADVALRIGVQACQGLQKAHEAGIVHRDIKPANLFLAARGSGDLVVKVLDFGIAKMTLVEPGSTQKKGPLTRTGTLVGSPLYMSPEQTRSKGALDHRTDIWSLGIVLYQALSGRTPFDQAESLGDFILAVCTTAATPLRVTAPWVDAAVAQVVQRALAIEPGDRYQTADEMREALLAFLPDGAALRTSMLVPALDSAEDRGPDTQPATPFVLPDGPTEMADTPAPLGPAAGTARSAGNASSSRLAAPPSALIPATLPGVPVPEAVTSAPAPMARAATPAPVSSALARSASVASPVAAPIAVVPADPEADTRWRTRLLAVSVVLAATAGSLAAAYAMGWLESFRAPRRPVEVTTATTEPPPRPAPTVALHALAGPWWSEAGVAYEGVVTGTAVELRVREPDQLPGLGYTPNEAAFVLRPLAGEPGSFRVNAHIRPAPPRGNFYDHARAGASCVVIWKEVSGKQLKAAEVMDRLILQTVKLEPVPSMFVHEGNRIVECKGLADAKATENEIVLGRTPVTSPVPRWIPPPDAGAHDAGTHNRGYGAACSADAQCASHRCAALVCR
jgi:serine/threonine protein kinase